MSLPLSSEEQEVVKVIKTMVRDNSSQESVCDKKTTSYGRASPELASSRLQAHLLQRELISFACTLPLWIT